MMPPNSFDEMPFSAQEIEARQTELSLDRDQISHELEELKTEYTELFDAAVDCDESERKKYVQKIKLVKKKIKIKMLQKEKNSEQLATVILVGAARELVDRCEEDTRDTDSIVADPEVETDDVIRSIWNAILEYNLEYEIVAEVQNELELDLIDIEVEPEPVCNPIPEEPQGDLDVDIETEADPLTDFEESDFNLDSEGL